jgi:hypothetical protein
VTQLEFVWMLAVSCLMSIGFLVTGFALIHLYAKVVAQGRLLDQFDKLLFKLWEKEMTHGMADLQAEVKRRKNRTMFD